VNWAEIGQRVDAVGQELTPAQAERSPERARALLEARARILALPADPAATGERLELVGFSLANEIYALESRYVVQVFRLLDLTPLPGAEPPVFGVTAWRGDLLTILDLRPVLGLPVTALNDLGRVIVVGAERAEFGVLADAVLEMQSVPASELGPPGAGQGKPPEYLRGITRDAVLVLDGSRLLGLAGPESAERSPP
jgi:purine-binding chemotaxis protein CheW